MLTTWCLLVIITVSHANTNLPPTISLNREGITVEENTDIGSEIFTLQGSDPEGSPVSFGVEGTDMVSVDPGTGVVSLAREIDRETLAQINFLALITDQVDNGEDNTVKVPVSVMVQDLNDNPPRFSWLPYEASVYEDIPVGTAVFRALEVRDVDLEGDTLEVTCLPVQSGEEEEDLCDYFDIVPSQEPTVNIFRANIVLRQPLNYSEHQTYQIKLAVTDGQFNNVTTDFQLNILQFLPVFQGSLMAVVDRAAAVGTIIINLNVEDGDTESPGEMIYELVDPQDYFALDVKSGALSLARELEEENSRGRRYQMFNVRVRAYKAVEGQLKGSTTAVVTILCPFNNAPQVHFRNLEHRRVQEETIPLNADVGKLVAIVSVTDSDRGDNGRTTVRITQGNEAGHFSLDSTGDFHVLRTAGKLNSETTEQYRITVEVEDSGTPAMASDATLLINIIDYRIELRGGNGVSSGNVFAVNRLGYFGPVCDDDWGTAEANTVCRQLGFDYGRPTKKSRFGSVRSRFAMDNVQCGSRGNILQECSYSTKDDCRSSEGAGVRCYHGQDSTRRPYVVTDLADFNAQLEAAGDKLVVADFFASWCVQSKKMAPHVQRISRTMSDVVVLMIDVDESEDLAEHYNIDAMPTFIFFKNMEEIDDMVGANVDRLNEIVNDNK